jgi:hypothetical protein
MRATQNELAGDIGQIFNLAGECGVDPERVVRERQEAEAAAAAAREYQRKMQRSFEQCPGFIGADAPSSERSKGCVIIEPAMAREARDWLKRRFHINENLELSDQGLCIEIIPRVRKARGVRSAAVSFAKTEQFTLAL